MRPNAPAIVQGALGAGVVVGAVLWGEQRFATLREELLASQTHLVESIDSAQETTATQLRDAASELRGSLHDVHYRMGKIHGLEEGRTCDSR